MIFNFRQKVVSGDNSYRWSILILVSFLLLFYWPAVFGGDYLYGDDYDIRQRVQTGRLDWIENLFTQMGRPIYGLLNNVIFRSFNTISDYAWVRAFGLLGTLLCALKIRSLGIRFQWPMAHTLCVILVTLAGPGWAVYVGWTMCAPFPWAGFLSLCAGSLLLPDIGKRPRLLFVFFAVILSLISICIYQITASLVLIPFIFWLRKPEPFCRRVIIATYVYLTMAITYGGNMLLIRTLKDTMFATANKNLNRDGIVVDIGARFEVLYVKVYPFLVEQWTAFLLSGWIILVEIVLFTALLLGLVMVLLARDSFKASTVRFLFYLPCLFLVAAPFVLLKEDNFPLRMFPVLNGTLWLGFFLVIPSDFKAPYAFLHKAFLFFIGAWFLLQMSYGAYVFREGLVDPNVREVKAWKKQLSSQFNVRPDVFVYYEPIINNDDFSRLPRIREYGHASASYIWVGQHAINTYFDELFPDDPKGQTINLSLPDAYSVYGLNCPSTIYGWKVATPRFPPVASSIKSMVNHHLLGQVSELKRGWMKSWIGVFNSNYWPWIQHVDFGWLWIDEAQSTPEKIVLIQKGGNLFELSPERFPKVYWKRENRWIDPCTVAGLSK